MNEMARFLAVTVAGVVLDIAIAYALHTFAGVHLAVSAMIGFVCAASANYVAHQLWSFREGPRQLSWARAAKYAGAAGVTLALRVGVVAMLAAWSEGAFALLILICGAGVSFFANFTLSKLFVFGSNPKKERAL